MGFQWRIRIPKPHIRENAASALVILPQRKQKDMFPQNHSHASETAKVPSSRSRGVGIIRDVRLLLGIAVSFCLCARALEAKTVVYDWDAANYFKHEAIRPLVFQLGFRHQRSAEMQCKEQPVAVV